MALAKERSIPPGMTLSSSSVLSPQIPYSADHHPGFHKQSPFRAADNQSHDAESVIDFSTTFLTSSDQSVLSFEQKGEYYNNSDQSYDWNTSDNPRFSTDLNCFQTASAYNSSKLGNHLSGNGSYGWLYSESTSVTTDSLEESRTQESSTFNKRPHVGESIQAVKKQCSSNATNKKHKVQNSSPSKDPQSVAAKNRRERISERLKILQELVPNGSKVDLVTMLEKAISYVKFLQLQVKVLATDEFWPVQGGKAPDISQVREAIDAILSSQRDRSSSFQ